jgi:fluoroacetyl-CoA thioesterase
MRQITVGNKGFYTLVVGVEHLASSANPALPQVMATPIMILMMEQAAQNALVDYMDPGETSVGTVVNVEHLAATPIGHTVRAEAEVVKVEGRRIEFRVAAFDEHEQVGRGIHGRAVVDLRKFNQRLQAKTRP